MVRVSALVGLGLAAVASAHPGHDVKAEAAERAAALKGIRARGVEQCSTQLAARGVETNNIARREQTLKTLRKARGLDGHAPLLKARDLTPLNETHESDLVVDLAVDPEVLFSSGGSCVLAEDVTQGPYYVSGELIRNNLVEDQEGVPLYLDIQLIDSNSCEPVPDVYIDFWHCNSTGVYSGVVASGNGDSTDESNLDSTFLRGLQRTDTLGVASFHSLFPGHYTGRATHIHVLSHPANNTNVNRNNETITDIYSSKSSHVGQIFFDQDLITAVESVEPYASNTQELTLNADDSILLQELNSDIDPFVEYSLVGDDISEGVFAWITVVIDSSVSSDVSPAAYYTEEGGVENENSGMGMGGGGGGSGGPGGEMPSGGVPSGVPTGVPPS